MMYAFFFDIDGTLMPFGEDMPQSAAEAIAYAQREGHKCLVSSGRGRAELPDFSPVEFDGLILSAGSEVIVENKSILDCFFTPDQIGRLLSYLEEKGLYPMIQTSEATYLPKRGNELWNAYYLKYSGHPSAIPGLTVMDGYPEGAKIRKVLFLGEYGGYPTQNVRRDLDGEFVVVDNTIGLPKELMGEIMLPGVTKATGIEAVLSHYGIPRENSIGIGDGMNDIEMIEYCGIGIAMGNACDEVKKVADFVTSDVKENGIYNAIRKVLSGE